jgi:hypothetical protein
MISEEKMTHIVHLIIDGLYNSDYVDYSDDDEALKEAKKVCLGWLTNMNSVSDLARKRILSQKNPPVENSPQWDVLFNKYCEEEIHKKGG